MTESNIALYGISRSDDRPITAEAGPVSCELHDFQLRHIRIGDVQIARRLYFALRPADWDMAYPTEITDFRIGGQARSFRASWNARVVRDEIDYVWSAQVAGQSDGTLTFRVCGESHSKFESPRIGMCLLLAADVLAGKMFEVEGEQVAQGTTHHHEFTRLIPRTNLAQRFRTLRFCPSPGIDVLWSVDRGYWDLEDQRNWAEATYKAFTALEHRYPTVAKGERVEQTVTMRFPVGFPTVERSTASGSAADSAARAATAFYSRRARRSQTVKVQVGTKLKNRAVPALGVDFNPADLSVGERKLFSTMRLAHLRYTLRAGEPNLGLAVEAARQAKAALLISVPEVVPQLERDFDRIRAADVQIAYLECRKPDEIKALRDVAKRAHLTAPIGGPGAVDFGIRADLRAAIDAGADFLSWGATPNGHLEDDETYLENSVGVRAQLQTMRYFAPHTELLVGPITIESPYQRLRPDPRQASLLAAAYAAGMIKSLADSGATAGTFFRSVGPHGIIHRRTRHPLPAYDSTDDVQVYPIYHVLWQMSLFRGAVLRAAETSDPRRAEALACTGSEELTLMLVNKTIRDQELVLTGLNRTAATAQMAVLDSTTFDEARLGHPLPTAELPLDRGRGRLELAPCAVAWITVPQ